MDDLVKRSDVFEAFSDVLDQDFPYKSEETPRERIESIPSTEMESRLGDVFIKDLEVYEVLFGEEVVTLNKNGVVQIKYHTPMGDGDAHYVDIYIENGNIIRSFNPDAIEFCNKEGNDGNK